MEASGGGVAGRYELAHQQKSLAVETKLPGKKRWNLPRFSLLLAGVGRRRKVSTEKTGFSRNDVALNVEQ